MLILALKWCAFVCGDDLIWGQHVSLANVIPLEVGVREEGKKICQI